MPNTGSINLILGAALENANAQPWYLSRWLVIGLGVAAGAFLLAAFVMTLRPIRRFRSAWRTTATSTKRWVLIMSAGLLVVAGGVAAGLVVTSGPSSYEEGYSAGQVFASQSCDGQICGQWLFGAFSSPSTICATLAQLSTSATGMSWLNGCVKGYTIATFYEQLAA